MNSTAQATRHSRNHQEAPIAKNSGLPREVIRFRIWQAITASAHGCKAAIDAERWLEATQGS